MCDCFSVSLSFCLSIFRERYLSGLSLCLSVLSFCLPLFLSFVTISRILLRVLSRTFQFRFSRIPNTGIDDSFHGSGVDPVPLVPVLDGLDLNHGRFDAIQFLFDLKEEKGKVKLD
jgi:hypothetical protein